jgi:undecaprenyl-diphosphatase
MLESIILGTLQGITEWLPISSEGIIVLVKNYFFQSSLLDLIKFALFLHLGTFFAALIYFWKDVKKLILTLFNKENEVKELKFLIIATVVSGILGLIILYFIELFENNLTGNIVNLIIGIMLIITGILQLKVKKSKLRSKKDLKVKDGLILGVLQSLAIIPGLSRSGLTVSVLLLSKFREEDALKLSFLMSLPIVLGANIILNFNGLLFSLENLIALLFSFIFGILTIHLLLKLAKKINFGYFALIFGLIVLLAVLI